MFKILEKVKQKNSTTPPKIRESREETERRNGCGCTRYELDHEKVCRFSQETAQMLKKLRGYLKTSRARPVSATISIYYTGT